MRKVIVIVPVLTTKSEKEFLEVLGVHIPGLEEAYEPVSTGTVLEAPWENVTWDMVNRMKEKVTFYYETRKD